MKVAVVQPTKGKARIRLSLEEFELTHITAGLDAAPLIRVEGDAPRGLLLRAHHKGATITPTSPKTGFITLPCDVVGVVPFAISSHPVDTLLERDEGGPIVRVVPLPTALLPMRDRARAARERAQPWALRARTQTAHLRGEEPPEVGMIEALVQAREARKPIAAPKPQPQPVAAPSGPPEAAGEHAEPLPVDLQVLADFRAAISMAEEVAARVNGCLDVRAAALAQTVRLVNILAAPMADRLVLRVNGAAITAARLVTAYTDLLAEGDSGQTA